jgi:hypothetical protein
MRIIFRDRFLQIDVIYVAAYDGPTQDGQLLYM